MRDTPSDANRRVYETQEEFNSVLLDQIKQRANQQGARAGRKKTEAGFEEMELDLTVSVRFETDEDSTAQRLPEGTFCCVCVKGADGVWHCTGNCC